MAILIESDEAEALLKEIGRAKGKAIAEVVLELARQEAARLRRAPADIAERRRRIEEACERYAARVGPNPPPHEEIVGYDENGLPR